MSEYCVADFLIKNGYIKVEPIMGGNLPPGFDSSTYCNVYVRNIRHPVIDKLLEEVCSCNDSIEVYELIIKEKVWAAYLGDWA